MLTRACRAVEAGAVANADQGTFFDGTAKDVTADHVLLLAESCGLEDPWSVVERAWRNLSTISDGRIVEGLSWQSAIEEAEAALQAKLDEALGAGDGGDGASGGVGGGGGGGGGGGRDTSKVRTLDPRGFRQVMEVVVLSLAIAASCATMLATGQVENVAIGLVTTVIASSIARFGSLVLGRTARVTVERRMTPDF